MLISVVVPTIAGREASYERCVGGYSERTVCPVEIITVADQPTCGHAWNIGAQAARGDYIHFTADDLEPFRIGWDQAARSFVDEGVYPAPVVYTPMGGRDYDEHFYDGELYSDIPFMSARQWEAIGPSLEIHYFSDVYLSWRAHRAGFEVRTHPAYEFVHHWHQHGRGAGMAEGDRYEFDKAIFVAQTEAPPVTRALGA